MTVASIVSVETCGECPFVHLVRAGSWAEDDDCSWSVCGHPTQALIDEFDRDIVPFNGRPECCPLNVGDALVTAARPK